MVGSVSDLPKVINFSLSCPVILASMSSEKGTQTFSDLTQCVSNLSIFAIRVVQPSEP